jgi:hypothetical protein
MADTTGPISTLPGAHYSVPAGAMCDDHPDRPATHRVQGETDSFGCELIDMCDECHSEWKAYRDTPQGGVCDWCGKHADKLRPRRDYDEGMCGRVYDVCVPCITRANQEAEEDLERSGWYD